MKQIIDANLYFHVAGPELLPEFNNITTEHGLKSFCNGIHFSPFNDVKQMYCTLNAMMDAQ